MDDVPYESTRDRSHWAGPNSQSSFVVNIRVRCWAALALPPPCFNQSNIYMQAKSSNIDNTFVELHHGLSKYPDLVKVRARLIDSLDKNWYTDAQGTSLWHRIVPKNDPTGGFGYSNASIRIWTSRASILYKREDGWGSRNVLGYAYEGDVEVIAWCDVASPRVFSGTTNIGPNAVNETLELTLPGERVLVEDVLVHAMMKVQDGNNEGFMFETIGSAMTNTMFHGTPCMYGGVIVAFDGSVVRIWRPDNVNGSAVCIPDTMGDGRYSQAAFGGKLTVVVYVIGIADENVYVPSIYMCNHFQRNSTNTGYNSSAIATTNATSLLACNTDCRTHYACALYTFNMALGCRMYNDTDWNLVYAEPNTELWTLQRRQYC
ncbi:uncharacterized protein LOC127880765 isoform X2 [Dreissena polymorpha]|nr:uncharacterized protein LOC127880765 isoform X2 [Dreissena polymorpha]